jgi:hypothetical protein
MKNTEDILKRILLNMKYDPKKSLVENKISIIKESNTLCKSIEDFIKDKNSCYFSKKGETYDNPFIPEQLYSYNSGGNTLYLVMGFIREESIKVFMGTNNTPTIEVTVFIDNETLISQLTTLFNQKGSVVPYEKITAHPGGGGFKYIGEFDEKKDINTYNMDGWDNNYKLDNGKGTVFFKKESATDDMIIKAVNIFNGKQIKGEYTEPSSNNSKDVKKANNPKDMTNPLSSKDGEDFGKTSFDLEL